MEVTADGDPASSHLADLLPRFYFVSRPNVNFREMRVQREQVIIMLNHHEVSVKNCPRGIDRHIVWSRKEDNPIPCRVDRSPQLIDEFHPAMRITRPVGGGSEGIRSLYGIIIGWMNGSLEDEMSIGDAEVGSVRVAGDWRICR